MNKNGSGFTVCPRRNRRGSTNAFGGLLLFLLLMQASAWAQEIRGAAGWVIRRAGGRNRGRWALFRHFLFRSAANSRAGCPDCARGWARRNRRLGTWRRLARERSRDRRRTVLAIVARRFFAQQVPDPRDSPWMLAGVAALMLVLTVLACLVPVRRALAVDPLTVLRGE